MPKGAESILLDTCACLWLTHGDPLSADSRAAIAESQAAHAGVYVSAITAWEVATLVSRRRYRLFVTPGVWFARLMALSGVRLAEASPDVLIDSAFLPGDPPFDPADRILAATARRRGLTLVTRDRQLLKYAEAGHLRALGC